MVRNSYDLNIGLHMTSSKSLSRQLRAVNSQNYSVIMNDTLWNVVAYQQGRPHERLNRYSQPRAAIN